MRPLTIPVAALCLVGCGDQMPQGKTASPADAPRSIRLTSVPAPFHGVWAATLADCKGSAETRLEITADRVRFHESSGPVALVDASDPSEILITVALTGEGAMSRRTFRYRLIDDGQALFDVRSGLRRIRCQTA